MNALEDLVGNSARSEGFVYGTYRSFDRGVIMSQVGSNAPLAKGVNPKSLWLMCGRCGWKSLMTGKGVWISYNL